MKRITTRTLSTALLGLMFAIGGCAYGQHREFADAGHAGGEPEPIPAPQHAPAEQAYAGAEPIAPEPMPMPQATVDEPPPAPQQARQTYTVREGDTLWRIAEDVYGDGQKWEQIRAANPGLRPEQMRVGQEIVLP